MRSLNHVLASSLLVLGRTTLKRTDPALNLYYALFGEVEEAL